MRLAASEVGISVEATPPRSIRNGLCGTLYAVAVIDADATQRRRHHRVIVTQDDDVGVLWASEPDGWFWKQLLMIEIVSACCECVCFFFHFITVVELGR